MAQRSWQIVQAAALCACIAFAVALVVSGLHPIQLANAVWANRWARSAVLITSGLSIFVLRGLVFGSDAKLPFMRGFMPAPRLTRALPKKRD